MKIERKGRTSLKRSEEQYEGSQSDENGSSEDYSNSNAESSKNKKISKTKGKGVKRGRPKKDDNIEIAFNPTSNMQLFLLQYFANVGLPHGIIFKEEQRKKLITQKIVKWKSECFWDKTEQKNKIKKNPYVCHSISEYVQKSNNNQIDENQIIQLFMTMSDNVSDQCTEEIYLILAFCLNMITNKFQHNQRIAESATLFDSLIFLNRKFTKLQIKYYIEKKPNEKEMRKLFEVFIENICKQLAHILRNPNQFKCYINEQFQMQEKLKKIIDSYKQVSS